MELTEKEEALMNFEGWTSFMEMKRELDTKIPCKYLRQILAIVSEDDAEDFPILVAVKSFSAGVELGIKTKKETSSNN